MKNASFIMMVFVFAAAMFLALLVSVKAQAYLEENLTWEQNLTVVVYSSTAWGDIDGDGDLDLVLTGDSDGCQIGVSEECAEIYINNGTALVYNQIYSQNLTGVFKSSLAWGDVDNDGDLDLALIGCSNGNPPNTCNTYVARIYTDNGTSLVENSTWQENLISNLAFGGTMRGSLAWGDVDNDGDLDLALTGTNLGDNMSIYINNGTSLVADSIWYENTVDFWDSAISFGDIDGDGDLDLAVSGTAGGVQTAQSKIYINNGISFIENNVWGNDLVDVTYSSLAFGDYNNDDYLDLGIMGLVDSLYIYKNNGTTLIKNETNIFSIYDGAFAWGDYDNDGDIDIVGTGREYYTRIYINNETTFVRDLVGAENLTYIASGSLTWSDIDNDSDLDLILTGTGKTGPTISKIYTNNISITTPNTPPSPPIPPSNNYSYNNREITIVWGNGSDTETGTTGLYYNLRVGTAANRNAIVSGVYGGSSNPTAGYFGNMMQRKNITLKVDRLQPSKTYYWSVQTIDTALANGSWCAEQSFVTPADMDMPVVAVNSPADGYSSWNYTVVFNVSVSDSMNVSNVSLYGNWSAGWHLNSTNSSGANDTDYAFSVNFSGDGDGRYLWEVIACDNETNCQSTGNYTLIVDTTGPGVGFAASTPGNNTNLSAASVTINVSHTEVNPDTLILDWNGTNTSYAYSGAFSEIAKSGLTDGTYTYYAWANDTAGWQNQTETRTLTIDTVPISNVSLVWPTPDDGSTRSDNYTYINVSLSEIPDTCILEWDNGTPENISMTKSGTNCYMNMTNLISYVYSYKVHANDSADNWNSSVKRTVTVDTGNPIVILASPQHNSWNADGSVTFVYNASDTLLDSCSLYGNWSAGWHLNETNSSPNNGTYSSFSRTLADGNYAWNVICNDTAPNEGYSPSNLTVNIDTTAPIVTIVKPENRTYNSSPSLDFFYTESNPHSCWYNLNGTGNTSLASCNTNGTAMTSVGGSNYVILYMNDSAGNLNSTATYWTLDTTPPKITIDSPANHSYNSLWLEANVTLNENTSWCGYSLNSSANVSMSNDSMTHFYSNMTGLAEIVHTIAFSCNDTVGNMNTTAMLYFTIDRTAPAITNVSNSTASWNTISISWNTDEPGNSSVLYGTNATDLSLNSSNVSQTTSHNLTLTGLSGSTTYYYNASSCDSAGNCNMTGTYNFTTPACVESWSYSAWSNCIGGLQTRTATDLNSCGTTANRGALSRSCISGTGGGGSSLSSMPSASYIWIEIMPEETATVNIEKPEISFTRIDFEVNNEVSNANLVVARLDARPAEIEQEASGKVYQYLSISHTANLNHTSLKTVTIGFVVNMTWIDSNSINKSTVRLNRYTDNDIDNGWSKLGTWLVNETDNHISYESLSPGFSCFAVTGEAVNATIPPLCNNNSVCEPGLGEDEVNCPNDCPAHAVEPVEGESDEGGEQPATLSTPFESIWTYAATCTLIAVVIIAVVLDLRKRQSV